MKTLNAPINFRLLLAVTTATVLLAGCQQSKRSMQGMNDKFEPDDKPRSVTAIFDQQHRNGARQDGMLYAGHFTDGELNSLGRQKLDMMTSGPERGIVNVYMSVPKDNAYAARESSVIAFLSTKGLASNSYTLTAGDNPGTGAPAVQGLNGLAKQREVTESAASSAGPTGSK